MPRPKREVRNGQLWCPGCERWLHPSRFSPLEKCNGTVTRFRPKCRACEQSERTDAKNADRALHLVSQRASVRAQAAGVPNCGHPMLNERDIHLEHAEPPRHPRDFARHHARNIPVLCGSCNGAKHDKPYATWLDEQEDTRLSVAAYYGHADDEPVRAPEGKLSGGYPQGSLW